MAGHVFIAHGDLTALACDAWLLPTDATGHVMPHWHAAFDAGPELKPFGESRAQAVGADRRGHSVVAVNSGAVDREADWYADGFSAGIALAAGAPSRLKRKQPLIAAPLLGTGAGGAEGFRGDVVRALVGRAYEAVEALRGDVVLVAHKTRDFAAAQAARRTWLEGRGADPWELSDDEAIVAEQLAERARKGRLVHFLGAGVSAAAGLPSWTELILELAAKAHIEVDRSFADLDALDKAELIKRKLKPEPFRLAIAERFRGAQCSLNHLLLASMPVTEAATTNYDTLMEDAWEGPAEASPVGIVGEDAVQHAEKWLLKLHGSVRGNGRDLVLCRSDYLRLGTERQALAGVVHAMLLTRHMLFTGFSLTDPTFHRIAHDVRAVLGPKEERPGHEPFGTALMPAGNTTTQALWEDDVNILPLGDAADELAAHRRIEIFLDRVAFEASDPLGHLLDPTFAGVLSDEERELAGELAGVLAAVPLPNGRTADALAEVIRRMGGSAEREVSATRHHSRPMR